MVCYSGMSPAPNQPSTADQQQQQQQPEVTVMSDIYIYDIPTKRWTYVPAQDAPQGRYAHCACILPSSATFSNRAPLSALQHNSSTSNPNEGRIGVNIDGGGGAEMVIVGGQDGANHYIEQISVFNLRSLKWTSTQPFGKSCGAYRSVAAPLAASVAARIGRASNHNHHHHHSSGAMGSQDARESGSSMLIYSNYNFLDVKLELQIRAPDGSLTERHMSGAFSPRASVPQWRRHRHALCRQRHLPDVVEAGVCPLGPGPADADVEPHRRGRQRLQPGELEPGRALEPAQHVCHSRQPEAQPSGRLQPPPHQLFQHVHGGAGGVWLLRQPAQDEPHVGLHRRAAPTWAPASA